MAVRKTSETAKTVIIASLLSMIAGAYLGQSYKQAEILKTQTAVKAYSQPPQLQVVPSK